MNYSLDLAKFGVPPQAEVLNINYTPHGGGGLFPVELHGNSPAMERGKLHKFALYPWHLDKNQKPGPTVVSASVTYRERAGDDPAWGALSDAFIHMDRGHLLSVIVPANVAVEIVVGSAVSKFLEKHQLSRTRIKTFLVDAATYSHQLNLLLPLVATHCGRAPISDYLRGFLNTLRDERNSIAHRGVPMNELDTERVADLLTAAMFGYVYVTQLSAELDRISNDEAQS